MIEQQAIDRALWQIAVDLSTTMPGDVQLQRLVSSIGNVLPCDAVALFYLQDGLLVPMACHGLPQELLARRFNPQDHPRLQTILSRSEPTRFEADSTLPDPFDGLLDPEREHPVHACLGCGLRVDNELVGALTLDALDRNAFGDLTDSSIAAFAALAAATLRNVALIRNLKLAKEKQQAIARDLTREGFRREGHLIGQNAALQGLKHNISLVAATDLAVLITGETGTGKELVARTVHAQSPRASQALVQINCAALPESVAESELFGHSKGAFTGASSERLGKFELADGGTLFLDEIGELPLNLQAKLLRALQQGEIQRIGSDQLIRVNVRIIAATNRNLASEIEAGRFRADLYHRLHIFPLHVPPLREHVDDIGLLAGYFLEAARQRLGLGPIDLHPSALEALQGYDWPGNVRELEHLLLRASLKASRSPQQRIILRMEDLELPQDTGKRFPYATTPPTWAKQSTADHESAFTSGTIDLRQAVDDFQRQIIHKTLNNFNGNWTQAARQLKVDRANLQRLARRLGIETTR